jgi:hypothetical protein
MLSHKQIGTSTFISDAARPWNRTSGSLKNFTTLTSAKKGYQKPSQGVAILTKIYYLL